RHTRFSRDWSSDVCSSDLAVAVTAGSARAARERAAAPVRSSTRRGGRDPLGWERFVLASGFKRHAVGEETVAGAAIADGLLRLRSEGRRVGERDRNREMER